MFQSPIKTALPQVGGQLTNMQKLRHRFSVYVTLTKPRIQIMLVFTAYAAMIVARRGLPDWRTAIFTLVGLVLATGGSAAINMWYDRDIDIIMSRTSNRPIPQQLVKPHYAAIYGTVLIILSFVLLIVFVNLLTAVLAVLGAFYYAVFYTMWLKRRTPQNIVIGGGAGAFPPLIGWAGVTGHLSLAPVIMFAIIFFWTPPHFWSLALYKNADYVKAKIPMMPVVRGATSTKRQSIAYAVVLLFVSLLLSLTGYGGLVFNIFATLLGLIFLVFLWMTLRESNDSFVWAKRTFKYSLIYLPMVFLVMVVSAIQ